MPDSDSSDDRDNGLPVVAGGRVSNVGLWAFGTLTILGGIWIFSMLSANRVESEAPASLVVAEQSGQKITASPPLAVPQSFLAAPELEDRPVLLRRVSEDARPSVAQPAPAVVAASPRQSYAPQVAPPPAGYARPPVRPSVVFDSAFQNDAARTPVTAAGGSRNRVEAERFVKPSQTIPQGTVIPAVLETALDSTRAGAARALVQRDIYSFDGTRILIHRGSRLYGEYDSGLEAGQKRALIQWTRLIRPDGVTIALDSPSSDPLGRAGVKGKVDGKFFQRFGGAILQSVLDVGVGLATQELGGGDGVFVALPGSTQNIQGQRRNQVQRTLKIKHGTSVSVFVARDLDFSSVDF